MRLVYVLVELQLTIFDSIKGSAAIQTFTTSFKEISWKGSISWKPSKTKEKWTNVSSFAEAFFFLKETTFKILEYSPIEIKMPTNLLIDLLLFLSYNFQRHKIIEPTSATQTINQLARAVMLVTREPAIELI